MENEIFWQAVKNNDARFNGAFVYAVESTKIYCKPSCASKLPKRENVKYFDDFMTAESSGFRPCRRCQPKEEAAANPQMKTVIRACEILEREERISLEDLSAKVGLS